MGERWELSDDALIDDASCCAQFRPLCRDMDETDESLRECIKINVCKPLRQRIAELEFVLREVQNGEIILRRVDDIEQQYVVVIHQDTVALIDAALGEEVDGGD